MPKARLRYAVAADARVHAEGSTDPVVYGYGGVGRGAAAPFVVRRGWSGPQGAYVEQFRVVHPESRLTLHKSEPRILELAGEYYTDELVDRVEGLPLELGEYELIFTLDDEPIPSVPLFVEPGPGAAGGPPAIIEPLVAESVKKSDLVWLTIPGEAQQTRPAWHVFHQGAVYLVFDGSEQRMPGLVDADNVLVTVRSKDKGGTVVAFRAAVDLVPVGSPTWNEITPLLVGKRLNNRDADAAPERWARECHVARLVPTGEVPETWDAPRTDARREEPADTSATTHTHVPITFHAKPKRRART